MSPALASPARKPSGVPWLGDIPAHWEVKRLCFVTEIKKGRLPGETSPIAQTEQDLPYLSMEYLRGETSSPNYISQSGRLLVANEGDLLILWDGSNAGEFLRSKRGVVSSTVARIEPQGINREFLFYAAKAIEPQIKDLSIGMGIPHVDGDALKSACIPLPPPDEQRAIADHLDRRTAQIDRLVERKRTLVSRLREKRSALIARCVTRGLTPDAPLRPSGIPWLGDIPAHWEIVALKWNTRCSSGDGIPTEDISAELTQTKTIPVIGGNGTMGYCDESNCNKQTLVIGRVGALCGNVHNIKPPVWITDNALIMTANQSLFNLHYLSATLRTRNLNELADKTAQPLVTGTRIRAEKMPIPPLAEQAAIAAHLDRETGKIDRLIDRVETAVERLLEYRSAIITVAVTGKISF